MSNLEEEVSIIESRLEAAKKAKDFSEVVRLSNALMGRRESETAPEPAESAEKDEAARRAEEAEQAARAALESANKRLVKSEFKLRAAAAGVLQDALDDAFVLADLSDVNVNDDGEVDGQALDSLISSMVEQKPYLMTGPKPSQPKSIGGPSSGGYDRAGDDLRSMLESAKKDKDFSKVVQISNALNSKGRRPN